MNLPAATAIAVLFTLLSTPARAEASADATLKEPSRQYTFTWRFQPESEMAPRGGTTQGAEVTLVSEPTPAWRALQEPGISRKEKDRRAILAMAGPYRASFDFIEAVGLNPGYTPPRPYQSWGTEYVYVVADQPDFISLQHILVMFMTQPDGSQSEPIVVKHWRQDWQYEQRRYYAYTGHNHWRAKKVPRGQLSGTWVQSVYQVDDSPRYAAFGRWEHTKNYSSWISSETWRPLPRREFSVRSDYDTLVGTNRHTITPTGWVHLENNKKVVLSRAENPEPLEVLSVEVGLNRYEQITQHDWSAGDNYWAHTGAFWANVRNQWAQLLREGRGVKLHTRTGEKSLFAEMFSLASTYAADAYDAQAATDAIARTLRDHTAP